MEYDTNIPGVCNCPKCGRPPVIVKTRTKHWRVGCPYLDCIDISSIGQTEKEAIQKWNDGEVET